MQQLCVAVIIELCSHIHVLLTCQAVLPYAHNHVVFPDTLRLPVYNRASPSAGCEEDCHRQSVLFYHPDTAPQPFPVKFL